MNTSVVEGAPAQFTCQVEGNPKPKVKTFEKSKKNKFFFVLIRLLG
jgi:hypothetical protein